MQVAGQMLALTCFAAKQLCAMQVFTTCGSAGKRAFLQQTFPWLDGAHVGDSRSTSFEATVLGQVSVNDASHVVGSSRAVWRGVDRCLYKRMACWIIARAGERYPRRRRQAWANTSCLGCL